MNEQKSLKTKLVTAFKNAIVKEQESDLSLTNSYLTSYSPKKLSQYGLAVINLSVSSIRTGLGGKTLLELEVDHAVKGNDNDLKVGTIRVGDIVKLSKMIGKSDYLRQENRETDDSESNLEAVVSKITANSILVSVDDDMSDEQVVNIYNNTSSENARVWIAKLSNSITFKRMISTMNKLEEMNSSKIDGIIQLLLGETVYQPWSQNEQCPPITYFNRQINESQKNAINFAVNVSPISIIHGPPGTGKTYTIIELIKQLVFNKNERVLVCAPSNIAVDTILERLSLTFTSPDSNKEKGKGRDKKGKYLRVSHRSKQRSQPEMLIRIGHPARLLSKNLEHSLDVLSKGSSSDSEVREVVNDIEKEISETLKKIRKSKQYGERKALWSELKLLKKELRVREKKIIQQLLLGAKVVLSTLHGAGSYELTSLHQDSDALLNGKPLFDTIIIDEVSQSMEPQCWIPLVNHLGFKRLVIAGDNRQLPPTLKSKDVKTKASKVDQGDIADLEMTLFDRLVKDHEGNLYKKLLDVQYRMNYEIMCFPSKELYEGKLKASDEVANIVLGDIVTNGNSDDLDVPCIWYDTQGGDYPEQTTDDRDQNLSLESVGSKYNEMEILIVMKHLRKLIAQGVKHEDIGIISPYSAQVTFIKRALQAVGLENVEVSTVDGFQGREKEVIVISLVRSNTNAEVGFLKDERRLNVAMTRPKRQLCVIGDLDLMAKSGIAFLKHWSDYVEQEFEIRYPDLDNY